MVCASDATLTVRNYISIVAEAIGCIRTYKSDVLGHTKRSGDLNVLVEAPQSTWKSHGLSKEQAKDIARKYSWATIGSPRKARDATESNHWKHIGSTAAPVESANLE